MHNLGILKAPDAPPHAASPNIMLTANTKLITFFFICYVSYLIPGKYGAVYVNPVLSTHFFLHPRAPSRILGIQRPFLLNYTQLFVHLS